MAQKIKRTSDQALARLMEQCAKSEKCIFDVRQALYRWGVEPDEHDGIIERLSAEKFIDEERYASAYVREKSNLNRWGRHKIRASLRAKRIPENIIETALGQIESGNDAGKLERHLCRKLRTVKYRDHYDLKIKLLRYGTGLGFDYSEVMSAVERLTVGMPNGNGITDSDRYPGADGTPDE